LAGDGQALEVAAGLADWVDWRTSRLLYARMPMVLENEYGALPEALANLYAITGTERYLAAAQRFYHARVLDPLAAGEDVLPGLQCNVTVPKIISCVRLWEETGNRKYRDIAQNFWRLVTGHYTYVIGGSGNYEHWHAPDVAAGQLSNRTCEGCVTYHMLKLTRLLHFHDQERTDLLDYYERALFNQMLGTQDPDSPHGFNLYYTGLSPGAFKQQPTNYFPRGDPDVYSTDYANFACDNAAGMETQAKFADTIYTRDARGRVTIPGQQLRRPGQELDHCPVRRGPGRQRHPHVCCPGELVQLRRCERGGHGDVVPGQQLPRLGVPILTAGRAGGQRVPELWPHGGQHQHRGPAEVAQQLPEPGGDPLTQRGLSRVEIELGLVQPHHGPRPDARQLGQRRTRAGRVDRMLQPARRILAPQQVQGLPAGPGLAGGGPADQHRNPAAALRRRAHYLAQHLVMLARHIRRQDRQPRRDSRTITARVACRHRPCKSALSCSISLPGPSANTLTGRILIMTSPAGWVTWQLRSNSRRGSCQHCSPVGVRLA